MSIAHSPETLRASSLRIGLDLLWGSQMDIRGYFSQRKAKVNH
jgi:hypothetical protein